MTIRRPLSAILGILVAAAIGGCGNSTGHPAVERAAVCYHAGKVPLDRSRRPYDHREPGDHYCPGCRRWYEDERRGPRPMNNGIPPTAAGCFHAYEDHFGNLSFRCPKCGRMVNRLRSDNRL